MSNRKYIKNINEFAASPFGDSYGFGTANGVLKVSYKPYDDLSVAVGKDPNIEDDVEGSEFKIGDIVISQTLTSDDDIVGTIVRAFRTPKNDAYRYFIQRFTGGKKRGKIIEVKANHMKFYDGGEHGNMKTVTKIKNNRPDDSSVNSKTVYSASELGTETVGG